MIGSAILHGHPALLVGLEPLAATVSELAAGATAETTKVLWIELDRCTADVVAA